MILKTIRTIKTVLLVAVLLSIQVVWAASFEIDDIVIEGLERISPGTVFTHLPVKVGDIYTDADSSLTIRELFKTELFSDVSLRRDGNILVVVVRERPGISSISISGNKDIAEEQLLAGLTDIGIATGRVLNRSVLERLENELLQQYFARGKYSVEISTLTNEVPRNLVDIEILIAEGEAAEIKDINIVGNTIYQDKELQKDFESGKTVWWQFWNRSKQYSKQSLSADLEQLRSTYLNTGYLNFEIDSTQVSITPDKEDIFITININEGDQYILEEVSLAGNFVVPEEELRSLVNLEAGQIFSRGEVVATSQLISNRLGEDGYAFARVNPVPDVNDETKTVSLTFFIDPGKQVYVRRINISGNDISKDEVYRRELRQVEGGFYSQEAINISRARIARLSFVETVDIQTVRITGKDDLVDIDVIVSERLAGQFSIGAGLSGAQGIVLNTSVSQENFLGTGKSVSFQVNTSRVNTVYDLTYVDPYYTIDGVSRGFGFSFISTDAAEADISDFDSEQFSLRANYGIPLTEVDRVNFTGDIRKTDIRITDGTSDEINEFLDENGDKFLNFSFTGSYLHDSRNRRVFGTSGLFQRLRFEFSVPGSDLEFYKIDYENTWLYPISDIFTLAARSELGYGDGYGNTDQLPFFENFRAGGNNSVRGFRDNTLGPQDSDDDAFGGGFVSVGSLELFFPIPAIADQRTLRFGIFADVGNVFADFDEFESSELRGSLGAEINLITGFGGISLSAAAPFNDGEEDELEVIQFDFGTSF